MKSYNKLNSNYDRRQAEKGQKKKPIVTEKKMLKDIFKNII
jgi:hypothetical protein